MWHPSLSSLASLTFHHITVLEFSFALPSAIRRQPYPRNVRDTSYMQCTVAVGSGEDLADAYLHAANACSICKVGEGRMLPCSFKGLLRIYHYGDRMIGYTVICTVHVNGFLFVTRRTFFEDRHDATRDKLRTGLG